MSDYQCWRCSDDEDRCDCGRYDGWKAKRAQREKVADAERRVKWLRERIATCKMAIEHNRTKRKESIEDDKRLRIEIAATRKELKKR